MDILQAIEELGAMTVLDITSKLDHKLLQESREIPDIVIEDFRVRIEKNLLNSNILLKKHSLMLMNPELMILECLSDNKGHDVQIETPQKFV